MQRRDRKIDKAILFFGACDVLYIAIYVLRRLLDKKIPFYSDVLNSVEISSATGTPMPIVLSALSICLMLSLLLSGIFLVRRKKAGAIVVYFQFPFRVFLAMPSFYFLIWPLTRCGSSLMLVSSVTVISDIVKLLIVINWARKR